MYIHNYIMLQIVYYVLFHIFMLVHVTKSLLLICIQKISFTNNVIGPITENVYYYSNSISVISHDYMIKMPRLCVSAHVCSWLHHVHAYLIDFDGLRNFFYIHHLYYISGITRHGVNSILSIPIPIPINSIWSIPIPIPHQIYQFQFQFQFKIDQFQFNSVYIYIYNLCKIFLILIHLLFSDIVVCIYIIIHIAIYIIYMHTCIQTNNMFMMLWCVFICDCYTRPS